MLDARQKEKEAQKNLSKSKEEKLKAMQDLVDMSSWYAKRWIPPMIRDNDYEVRLLASKLIVELERTEVVADLKYAIENEKMMVRKNELSKQLILLENIIKTQ